MRVTTIQQHQSSDSKEESQRPVHREETTNWGVEEEACEGERERQEATTIWELAKKLGVTGVDDQGRIMDKLMTMKDRDKKEADKVGNRNHNP